MSIFIVEADAGCEGEIQVQGTFTTEVLANAYCENNLKKGYFSIYELTLDTPIPSHERTTYSKL